MVGGGEVGGGDRQVAVAMALRLLLQADSRLRDSQMRGGGGRGGRQGVSPKCMTWKNGKGQSKAHSSTLCCREPQEVFQSSLRAIIQVARWLKYLEAALRTLGNSGAASPSSKHIWCWVWLQCQGTGLLGPSLIP